MKHVDLVDLQHAHTPCFRCPTRKAWNHGLLNLLFHLCGSKVQGLCCVSHLSCQDLRRNASVHRHLGAMMEPQDYQGKGQMEKVDTKKQRKRKKAKNKLRHQGRLQHPPNHRILDVQIRGQTHKTNSLTARDIQKVSTGWGRLPHSVPTLRPKQPIKQKRKIKWT